MPFRFCKRRWKEKDSLLSVSVNNNWSHLKLNASKYTHQAGSLRTHLNLNSDNGKLKSIRTKSCLPRRENKNVTSIKVELVRHAQMHIISVTTLKQAREQLKSATFQLKCRKGVAAEVHRIRQWLNRGTLLYASLSMISIKLRIHLVKRISFLQLKSNQFLSFTHNDNCTVQDEFNKIKDLLQGSIKVAVDLEWVKQDALINLLTAVRADLVQELLVEMTIASLNRILAWPSPSRCHKKSKFTTTENQKLNLTTLTKD